MIMKHALIYVIGDTNHRLNGIKTIMSVCVDVKRIFVKANVLLVDSLMEVDVENKLDVIVISLNTTEKQLMVSLKNNHYLKEISGNEICN